MFRNICYLYISKTGQFGQALIAYFLANLSQKNFFFAQKKALASHFKFGLDKPYFFFVFLVIFYIVRAIRAIIGRRQSQ